MTKFESILAATDLSPRAEDAVCRAALLARQHEAELRILHVVNRSGVQPARPGCATAIDRAIETVMARESLRCLVQRVLVEHGLTASLDVRVGDPAAELLSAADGADLLVLGAPPGDSLQEQVGGSVARSVLKSCRQRLLFVKRAVSSPYRRVLIPVDFTSCADVAAIAAVSLAGWVELQVFHAFISTSETMLRGAAVKESVIRDSLLRQEEELLERMRERIAAIGLDSTRISFALGQGPAVAATLGHANSSDVDLLVTGTPRNSTSHGSLLGQASRLMMATCCDLLTVPHSTAETLTTAGTMAVQSEHAVRRLPDALLAALAPAFERPPSVDFESSGQ